MKNGKKLLVLALCILMALSLCACGNSSSSRQTEEAAYVSDYYSGYSYDYDAEAVADEAYGGLAPTALYASANSGNSSAVTTSKTSGSGEGGAVKDDAGDINPEKIIYSAEATVETTAFDDTVSALDTMIDTYGGWIESSSVNGAKYSNISRGTKTNRTANYTVRVPNGRFSEMMNALSSLGNVPYSHVYTENVTSQYYDTQARLTTYEAQEQRLLALLDKAETVSDVIEVEAELTDVRYRIESLQTSLRGWDRRVSWSTIRLTVNEVSEYTPAKQRTYGERLSEAFASGLEALADLFVDFVEALPVLAFLLLLLIVLILIIRRVLRSPKRLERRRAKAEEKAARLAAKAEEKGKE